MPTTLSLDLHQCRLGVVALLKLALPVGIELQQSLQVPAAMSWHRNDPGLIQRLQQSTQHRLGLLVSLNGQKPGHPLLLGRPVQSLMGELLCSGWVVGSIQPQRQTSPPHRLQAAAPAGFSKPFSNSRFRHSPAKGVQGLQRSQGHCGIAALDRAGQPQLP